MKTDQVTCINSRAFSGVMDETGDDGIQYMTPCPMFLI